MNEPQSLEDKKPVIINEPLATDSNNLVNTNDLQKLDIAQSEIPADKKPEIIRSLHDRSWVSFDERRRHEYQISITFWTIYIITTGFILKEGLPRGMKWPLAAGMFLLAIVYINWNYNLAKTQQLDRTMAIYFGEELLDACGLKDKFYAKFSPKENKRVMGSEKAKLRFWDYLKNWNHRSESLVTLLLAIASCFAIYFAK